MDKDRKKALKAKFKKSEQDALEASLPLSIGDLKDLLSSLNRVSAPACDHTLKETLKFLASRNLDAGKIVPWLREHGGHCDCEVVFNVYDDVGDLVEWHLEEET